MLQKIRLMHTPVIILAAPGVRDDNDDISKDVRGAYHYLHAMSPIAMLPKRLPLTIADYDVWRLKTEPETRPLVADKVYKKLAMAFDGTASARAVIIPDEGTVTMTCLYEFAPGTLKERLIPGMMLVMRTPFPYLLTNVGGSGGFDESTSLVTGEYVFELFKNNVLEVEAFMKSDKVTQLARPATSIFARVTVEGLGNEGTPVSLWVLIASVEGRKDASTKMYRLADVYSADELEKQDAGGRPVTSVEDTAGIIRAAMSEGPAEAWGVDSEFNMTTVSTLTKSSTGKESAQNDKPGGPPREEPRPSERRRPAEKSDRGRQSNKKDSGPDDDDPNSPTKRWKIDAEDKWEDDWERIAARAHAAWSVGEMLVLTDSRTIAGIPGKANFPTRSTMFVIPISRQDYEERKIVTHVPYHADMRTFVIRDNSLPDTLHKCANGNPTCSWKTFQNDRGHPVQVTLAYMPVFSLQMSHVDRDEGTTSLTGDWTAWWIALFEGLANHWSYNQKYTYNEIRVPLDWAVNAVAKQYESSRIRTQQYEKTKKDAIAAIPRAFALLKGYSMKFMLSMLHLWLGTDMRDIDLLEFVTKRWALPDGLLNYHDDRNCKMLVDKRTKWRELIVHANRREMPYKKSYNHNGMYGTICHTSRLIPISYKTPEQFIESQRKAYPEEAEQARIKLTRDYAINMLDRYEVSVAKDVFDRVRLKERAPFTAAEARILFVQRAKYEYSRLKQQKLQSEHCQTETEGSTDDNHKRQRLPSPKDQIKRRKKEAGTGTDTSDNTKSDSSKRPLSREGHHRPRKAPCTGSASSTDPAPNVETEATSSTDPPRRLRSHNQRTGFQPKPRTVLKRKVATPTARSKGDRAHAEGSDRLQDDDEPESSLGIKSKSEAQMANEVAKAAQQEKNTVSIRPTSRPPSQTFPDGGVPQSKTKAKNKK